MYNYRYVRHNKCVGGRATKEIDGKTYCYGLYDCETEETTEECKKCPRLVDNNEEQIVAGCKQEDEG